MTTKPTQHEAMDAFLRGIDSKFKKMEDAFHAMGAFMKDYTSLYDSFVSYRKALRETLQEWNEASARVTTLEAENEALRARVAGLEKTRAALIEASGAKGDLAEHYANLAEARRIAGNKLSASHDKLEAENAELKARLSAMTADRNSWHG